MTAFVTIRGRRALLHHPDAHDSDLDKQDGLGIYSVGINVKTCFAVMPAKAGIQPLVQKCGVPAYAGTTSEIAAP